MNTSNFFRRNIDWTAVGKNSALTPEIRQHLTKVYTTLTVAVFTAAVGSFVELQTRFFAGVLSFIALIGLIFWMSVIPREQIEKRFSVLLGVAFLQGALLGPLIDRTLHLDPSIVVTAFLGTTTLFACFSGMSLFANRRSFFYLGGLLSSGLSLLAILSFSNIFFRSANVYNVQLYLGLLVFCGFIIFDTQLIIEKRFLGDKDFVGHALELFMDFINVFVRLLIILSKNKENKKKDSRR